MAMYGPVGRWILLLMLICVDLAVIKRPMCLSILYDAFMRTISLTLTHFFLMAVTSWDMSYRIILNKVNGQNLV